MKRLGFFIGIISVILIFLLPGTVLAERSMVYFYSPTCSSCMQVKDLIYSIEMDYPDLQLIQLSTADPGVQLILEEYGEKYEVEEYSIGLVPAVFYGDQAFIGELAISDGLEEALQNPELTIEPDSISTYGTEAKIVERFKSFNVGTILFAGLIDGINPCAFSTLIFFISFLVVTGQKGKKILFVGVSFTFGIFISYLAMGWGLFRLVEKLQGLTTVARLVYPITACLVTVLAVISFSDYIKVKRKKASKMTLQLPKSIVKIINKVVQRMMKLNFLIPASFIVGILISFLEFLCTGQIYLPTIVYITGVDHLKNQAFFYLILYNLSFVLPMIAIFLVAYKTNTSRIVAEYLNTRLQGIKLIATGLFVLLAAYMWILTFKFF